MAKPIVAVAVVAVGALGLAACASGSSGGSSSGGGGKTLIISTDLPLQGSSKDASDSTNKAIQLYLELHRQQGRQLHDRAARSTTTPPRPRRKWDEAPVPGNAQEHVANKDEVAVMGTLQLGLRQDRGAGPEPGRRTARC